MSRPHVTLILSLIFVLLGSGAARASTADEPHFEGEWVASPRLTTTLEAIAERYWSGRGVAPPTPVQLMIAPDASLEAAGRGELGGNKVWLAESLLPAPGLRGYRRSAALVTLCEAFLHERGHNATLTHEAGWIIMAETTGLGAAPRCESWAYRETRKQRAGRGSHSRHR